MQSLEEASESEDKTCGVVWEGGKIHSSIHVRLKALFGVLT
jgi:hypothetical protein